MKAGDHREYARQRRAEKEAEARALREDMSDPEDDPEMTGEPETDFEEGEPDIDPEEGETEFENEPEGETEFEDEEPEEEYADGEEPPEYDEEYPEGADDDDDEDEAPGSDKFSDRPVTSPDRPEGVPKLNIRGKKNKAKEAAVKAKAKTKKKAQIRGNDSETSDPEVDGDDDFDEPEPAEEDDEPSPDRRPPGRRRGETMRKLHQGAMRSARGYRSSDDEELTDGLEDDEYGGYTARSQFDGKTEYKSLKDAAMGYGKETTLGKDGVEHRVEDLPIKMAFEHLSSLAGMSQKVQDAINLSKSLFQRRMDKMDRGVLHKAWRGWLLVQLGFQKKKNILTRAVNKLRRRKLTLAFNAWYDMHTRTKKTSGMGGAARQVVVNGMRRRTFQAWREKAADSRRQVLMASNTAKLRDEFLERLVEVGLRQLRHKMMRRAWSGFDCFAEVRRGRRNRMRQAIARATHGQLSRAFNRWDEQATNRRRQRAMVKRAIARMSKGKLARCFDKWREADRHKKRCLMKVAKGRQARAWAKWRSNMTLLRKAHITMGRWKERTLWTAFKGWEGAADLKREQKRRCEFILQRMLRRGMRSAWRQWCWVVEDATGCSMDHVRALKDQNARLRRDNERFVRLVDSGEWGRGRVEELNEAGRVLREERRQLEELIKNIKSEKDGFVKDAMMQAQEARGLKDRLVSGNFVQRNKLTVRGGSSFNTIQRVLKQDMLDSGAAARHPAALQAYKVDRLALDKVSVFSDGEINVQATRADVEPYARSAARQAPVLGGSRGAVGGYPRGGRSRPAPPPAGGPPPSFRGRGGGPGAGLGAGPSSRDPGQSMLADALSSLSPDEVDALEDLLRRGRSAGAEKDGVDAGGAGSSGGA